MKRTENGASVLIIWQKHRLSLSDAPYKRLIMMCVKDIWSFRASFDMVAW